MVAEILDKLYNTIKRNLAFDGDSFFFNKGHILERQLRPLYDQVQLEGKIEFSDFQKEVEKIGGALAQACKDSPEGMKMVKDFETVLNIFSGGANQVIEQLNKKHFYVGD